jgi:ribonuclease P protein component
MAAEHSQYQGFARADRIKASREFARIKVEGQRLVSGCLIANWRCLKATESSRLGLITPKRIGRAVDRNRARRLVREAFRLHRGALASAVDLIVIARASIVGKRYAGVERDFLTILRKAGLVQLKREGNG